MGEILSNSTFINCLVVFILSFGVTYIFIPKIINVVNHKELMDKPNFRSSHKQLTPTFGGISFFFILIFTLYLIRTFDVDNIRLNIVAALTILLFTGLKDDLVVISSNTKILAQIAAISVFLFQTSFFTLNLHGFLGIHQINPIVGYLLINFIMFAVINSFNLIDGIDGLAATMGIIILTFFSVIFYLTNNFFNLLLSVSLIASLIAFLRYNLSTNKKIFMGDTGSLILGFTVAFMVVSFLNLDASSISEIGLIPKNSLLIVISILVFPLFDMARVFIHRVFDKKHPLKPDKNHTHHLLISFGNSHIKSSVLINLASILFTVILVFIASKVSNYWIIVAVLLTSFIAFYALIYVFFNKQKIKN